MIWRFSQIVENGESCTGEVLGVASVKKGTLPLIDRHKKVTRMRLVT
jgi:homospermidine synthase